MKGTAFRRWTPAIGPVVVAAVLLFALAQNSSAWLYNLTLVGLYTIVVVGLNVLVGYAGQVSFAQTAFMAVGGYSISILSVKAGLSPWLGLVVGIAVAAVVAVLVGLPLLRLRGHYLTMATFALAVGVFDLATASSGFTGGAIGISAVPPLTVGSFSLETPRTAFVLAWVLAGLAILVGVRLRRSHIGRAWRTVATREEIASSLGMRVTRYKVIAFVIAAVFAAVAGALYVSFTSYASPDLYDPSISVNIFVMLFLGGRGRALGPIVGAAFVVLLPSQIGGLSSIAGILFDCLLLVVILVLPGGLLSVLDLGFLDRWRRTVGASVGSGAGRGPGAGSPVTVASGVVPDADDADAASRPAEPRVRGGA